jgi:hypothetical protein
MVIIDGFLSWLRRGGHADTPGVGEVKTGRQCGTGSCELALGVHAVWLGSERRRTRRAVKRGRWAIGDPMRRSPIASEAGSCKARFSGQAAVAEVFACCALCFGGGGFGLGGRDCCSSKAYAPARRITAFPNQAANPGAPRLPVTADGIRRPGPLLWRHISAGGAPAR